MKSTKHTTRIINDVGQVPQGWIRLKAYTQTHGGSVRRLLSRAHYEGKVRAMKIMKTPYDSHGAVFVEPNDAKEFIWTHPQLLLWPGLMIFFSVMAFNLLGDALRDRLDPAQERH